jgi:hypothetical protein
MLVSTALVNEWPQKAQKTQKLRAMRFSGSIQETHFVNYVFSVVKFLYWV